MIYRTLGKTGSEVSVVGVGTWQFGGEWGVDFDQATVDTIFRTAKECGGQFDRYGRMLWRSPVGIADRQRHRERPRRLVSGHQVWPSFQLQFRED